MAGEMRRTRTGNNVLVTPTGGSVGRTQADLAADVIHIFNQIPPNQHNRILAGTASDYDAGPDINTLLTQAVSSGGKKVRVVGTPFVATTVEPRAGGILDLTGATLKAAADVPIVKMRPGGQLLGPGRLWAADVAGGYSSTALLIDGGTSSATWHQPVDSTRVRDIRVYNGKTHLGQDSAYFTGTGVKLTAQSGGRVWGVILEGVSSHGFYRPLHLLGVGTGWVNENYLLGFTASYGIYHVVFDGEANNCDANVFIGAAQPALGDANAIRNLVVNGAQNRIDFQSWDWTEGTAGTFAIEFQSNGVRNRLATNEHPSRVSGWRRAKLEDSNFVEFSGYGVPSIDASIYPHSKDFQTYAGVQDDLLAWGSVIGGISQTAGAAASSGILFSITDLSGSTVCSWNDTSTPIVLEFTLPAPEAYFMGACAGFVFGELPTNFKLEVYDGSWTTKIDLTNNASARISYAEDNHHLNVTKVRTTFSGIQAGKTQVSFGRMSAFGTAAGKAWLATTNAAIYGVPSLPGGLTEYADDAAAALGGLAVGKWYRTGSVIKFRVA